MALDRKCRAVYIAKTDTRTHKYPFTHQRINRMNGTCCIFFSAIYKDFFFHLRHYFIENIDCKAGRAERIKGTHSFHLFSHPHFLFNFFFLLLLIFFVWLWWLFALCVQGTLFRYTSESWSVIRWSMDVSIKIHIRISFLIWNHQLYNHKGNVILLYY